METSKAIKEARQREGLTQQALAEKVYVTRQTISKWELGKSKPDPVSLALLHKALPLEGSTKKRSLKESFGSQKFLATLLIILLSPSILFVRYSLFKLGKLENKRFILSVKCLAFTLALLYLRTLKDSLFYWFLGIFSTAYYLYHLYLIKQEEEPSAGHLREDKEG